MALTDATVMPRGQRGVLRDTILALMGMTRTTQKALAAHLGLNQSGLSKRLKRDGNTPFDEVEMETIAGYFRLDSPADLYDTQRAVSLVSERFRELRWSTGHAGQGTLFDLLIAA